MPSNPFNLRVKDDVLYFDMEDGSTWCMMGGNYEIYYGHGKELLTIWRSSGPTGPQASWSWHNADSINIYDLNTQPPKVIHGGLSPAQLEYVMVVRDAALELGLLQP